MAQVPDLTSNLENMNIVSLRSHSIFLPFNNLLPMIVAIKDLQLSTFCSLIHNPQLTIIYTKHILSVKIIKLSLISINNEFHLLDLHLFHNLPAIQKLLSISHIVYIFRQF